MDVIWISMDLDMIDMGMGVGMDIGYGYGLSIVTFFYAQVQTLNNFEEVDTNKYYLLKSNISCGHE